VRQLRGRFDEGLDGLQMEQAIKDPLAHRLHSCENHTHGAEHTVHTLSLDTLTHLFDKGLHSRHDIEQIKLRDLTGKQGMIGHDGPLSEAIDILRADADGNSLGSFFGNFYAVHQGMQQIPPISERFENLVSPRSADPLPMIFVHKTDVYTNAPYVLRRIKGRQLLQRFYVFRDQPTLLAPVAFELENDQSQTSLELFKHFQQALKVSGSQQIYESKRNIVFSDQHFDKLHVFQIPKPSGTRHQPLLARIFHTEQYRQCSDIILYSEDPNQVDISFHHSQMGRLYVILTGAGNGRAGVHFFDGHQITATVINIPPAEPNSVLKDVSKPSLQRSLFDHCPELIKKVLDIVIDGYRPDPGRQRQEAEKVEEALEAFRDQE